MIKKTALLFSVTIAIATLFFTSCTTKIDIDDLGDVTLNQSIVLPIGTVSASIEDVITMTGLDEYLLTDTNDIDNSMTYYISWELDNQQLSAVEHIGDFSFGSETQSEFDIAALPMVSDAFDLLPSIITSITPDAMTYEYNDTSLYQFDFNSNTDTKIVRVDQIEIGESTLDMNFTAEDIVLSETNYILFEIEFPMLSGQYDNFIVKLDSESASFSKVLNNFTASFEDDLNSIEMYFKYTIVSDGNMEIGRSAKIDISTQFNLIDFSLMKGYYWQAEPLYSDVYSFDIPSAMTSQGFIFSNPELSVHLSSNLGATTELTFNSIATIYENGDVYYGEFGNGETSTTITINSPDTPGEYATTDIVFNNEFGSLGTLLQNNATKISADLNLGLAKEEEESSFLINPDNIIMSADIYLPLQFDEETSIILLDTMAINFGSIDSYTDLIEEFYVMINSENSIPANLNTTLIFTDENYNELFRHSDITISSPDVDSEGKSISMASNEINIEFDETEVAEISNITYLIFEAAITSKDSNSKIYFQSTDLVKFTLAAFAKFNGEIDLNEIL